MVCDKSCNNNYHYFNCFTSYYFIMVKVGIACEIMSFVTIRCTQVLIAHMHTLVFQEHFLMIP